MIQCVALLLQKKCASHAGMVNKYKGAIALCVAHLNNNIRVSCLHHACTVILF